MAPPSLPKTRDALLALHAETRRQRNEAVHKSKAQAAAIGIRASSSRRPSSKAVQIPITRAATYASAR